MSNIGYIMIFINRAYTFHLSFLSPINLLSTTCCVPSTPLEIYEISTQFLTLWFRAMLES